MNNQTEFQIRFSASSYLFDSQIKRIKQRMEACKVNFKLEDQGIVQIATFSSERQLSQSDIFNLGCIVQGCMK